MREPSPVTNMEMCQMEWSLSAEEMRIRSDAAAAARRERTERIMRLSMADSKSLLDAIVAATVASSGLEATAADGASAKALFAWTLRAHALIAKQAATTSASNTTRRGANLTPRMIRDLWSASSKISQLLDTVDAGDAGEML